MRFLNGEKKKPETGKKNAAGNLGKKERGSGGER